MTTRTTSTRPAPACLQCRTRKVRCIDDGNDAQSCRGCKRLNFACSKASINPSSTRHERVHSTVQRKRVGIACTACRDSKSKCSGEAPCQRCRDAEIVCEFPQPRKQSRKPNQQPISPVGAGHVAEAGTESEDGTEAHMEARTHNHANQINMTPVGDMDSHQRDISRARMPEDE